MFRSRAGLGRASAASIALLLSAPPAGASVQNNLWIGSSVPGSVIRYELDGSHQSLPFTPQGPIGIAVDGLGTIWVASSAGVLWRVDGSGEPTGSYALEGSPFGVAVDGDGNVWVTTGAAGHSIVKFSPDG